MTETDARDAAALVLCGLRQGMHPGRDAEYRRLVKHYLDSTSFQGIVHAVAAGMQLRLLEIHPDAGAVLMAASTDSPFAMGLSDYRGSLGMDSKQVPRAAFVLAQAAVAAALYPSADTLEYPDPQPPSATASDVSERLLELARRLERAQGEDPEAGEASLAPGWRHILSLPNELPLGERNSPNSLRGLVQLVLNHLCEQRLLTLVERHAGEEDFYVATDRYRILLTHNAGSVLRVLAEMLACDPATRPQAEAR